ncbi:plasmid replication, integration and excision activator [Sinosporangium siamense]|uniref:Plasmid replication, integration and excision activator n=1 Tax=Sinosporangium siamense TaxID=1367973 RepID=A0A919VB91_9ACTN|nr:plasmid replication, integration and excision activator [Sinosporangium siamense]GII97321.1 hypothetical protein Ssi02_75520 [Sinosporangium siamense]
MALQGAIPVAHNAVFPNGCYVVGEVVAIADFDASTKDNQVQARDKDTNLPMWGVPVVDADPEARTRQKALAVKIASATKPVIPPAPAALAALGLPFIPVEFVGMTVTPYVDQGTSRLAYSYRANGMRPVSAADAAAPVRAKDAG